MLLVVPHYDITKTSTQTMMETMNQYNMMEETCQYTTPVQDNPATDIYDNEDTNPDSTRLDRLYKT
ncbi:MAG: hypothetical protein A6F71_10125 [Cycloclasticus sp. symbiont of Poecilosclerida sp. M]|nr:MAG: hypothetical protein A6F71_10125 [Cycloclasticus sp. symbiont of Poecilosclerida sp. M]